MNKQIIDKMKKRLLEMEQEYQDSLDAGKKDFESLNREDAVRDSAARGEILDQVDRAGLLETQDRERLRRIESALHKIDAGNYGKCETCGAPIKEERLEAVPETPFCLYCEKRRE
jgi:RNA polymerase-binding protein DksA